MNEIIADRPFITNGRIKDKPFEPFRSGEQIAEIWESLKTFFEACTTTSRDFPNYAELCAYGETYRSSENKEVVKKIFDETVAIFGRNYQSDPKVEGYPASSYWEIDPEELQKAIDYMIRGQPWPVYIFGPARLFMSYYFKWVDPDTKMELENQQFESYLLIFLSGTTYCSSSFSFPFSEANEDFKNYLFRIDKYLPLDLDPAYFRLCQASKNGNSNDLRKLTGTL